MSVCQLGNAIQGKASRQDKSNARSLCKHVQSLRKIITAVRQKRTLKVKHFFWTLSSYLWTCCWNVLTSMFTTVFSLWDRCSPSTSRLAPYLCSTALSACISFCNISVAVNACTVLLTSAISWGMSHEEWSICSPTLKIWKFPSVVNQAQCHFLAETSPWGTAQKI